MSTVETRVGAFVWHECMSTDVESSKRFYTELLGWEIEVYKPGEMDYAMISSGGTTHGGFMDAPSGAPSHWLGHVQVENVDAAAEKAKQAGGSVVAGPMDIPEVGRFCVIADPQGAVLSVYQPAGEGPLAEGVFVWDELMTADVEAAKSFYADAVGWSTSDMSIGGGTYTMFRRAGDVDAAGCMTKPADNPGPSQWLVYIGTDDVDGTVARAKKLGATTFVEGMDIPSVGRISVLADPAGAAFGLFQPESS
jgi:predicted enzyme related to lactoylglutathione lyase